MQIPGPLIEARLLARPNRFLTTVELDGMAAAAHLPDPGRLIELLVPGRRVWVRPETRPGRKTRFTLVLVEAPCGELVSVVTTYPNEIVAEALERRCITELAGWVTVAREHRWGRSRFDFLLGRDDKRMLLEVKSVTLLEGTRALFPDAVTARGARHLRELAAARRDDYEAALLFVVQRGDARSVTAAREIDPVFAEALSVAHRAGVRLLSYKCRVTFEEAILTQPLPVTVT
jgi:sugar fermentation stimulation protein A